MESITRHKFVKRLYDKLNCKGYSRRLSKRFIYSDSYWVTRAVFECMEDVLKEGNKLFVADCFTLQAKFVAEHMAEHGFEKPEERKVIPAHYIAHFKPLSGWRDIHMETGDTEGSGTGDK